MRMRFMKEGKRKDVLRALKAHGAMTHNQILEHVPGAARQDNRDMRDQGLIDIVGTVTTGRKPAYVYAITPSGLATLDQQRKPKADNRPRKGSTKWRVPKEQRTRPPRPRVIKEAKPGPSGLASPSEPKKPWEPPKPKPPPTITVPENVKVTVYQSQFTYQTYEQPKNFMECVR